MQRGTKKVMDQIEKEQKDFKQVIVIRKDLNMRKGKMVAQGSHASQAAIFDYGFYTNLDGIECLCIPLTSRNSQWIKTNFKKICVSVKSEQELLDIYDKACLVTECSLILDSGLTEFGGNPTYTAVAIGPDRVEVIDEITGSLPLL